MTEVRQPETPGVVIGNHCHKYTTGNPAIRWLTERFLGRLDSVLDRVWAEHPPAAVLEVGCGEGEIVRRLHRRGAATVTGLDLPDAGLRADWATVAADPTPTPTRPDFLHADAQRPPFADDTFDLTVSVEVLEHVTDPALTLLHMARVTRRDLILSVPREPIFRGGNLATGRHVRALGNTPGHLNHWTAGAFQRFASNVGEVRAVELPLPWTILWIRLP